MFGLSYWQAECYDKRSTGFHANSLIIRGAVFPERGQMVRGLARI